MRQAERCRLSYGAAFGHADELFNVQCGAVFRAANLGKKNRRLPVYVLFNCNGSNVGVVLYQSLPWIPKVAGTQGWGFMSQDAKGFHKQRGPTRTFDERRANFYQFAYFENSFNRNGRHTAGEVE